MAGASITITTEGDHAALAALRRAQKSLRDPTDLMRDIATSLRTSTQRRFEEEAAPDGTPWDERVSGGEHGLLRKSIRLYRSLTRAFDRDSAVVGTNVVYAAIHQFGGEIQRPARQQAIHRKAGRDGKPAGKFVKRGRGVATQHHVAAHIAAIPARPYLGLGERDYRLILKMTERFLAQELRS